MRRRREDGFTILEAAVVVIVGGILIGATINLYQKFIKIYRRQQGVVLVERELSAVQRSLGQVLATMPGRELGCYSGENYTIADLPTGGTFETEKGIQPIALGIVTPFKVGGGDAFTIVYGRRNAPRMELVETSLEIGDKGIARVVAPGISNPEELLLNAGDLMLLVGVSPSNYSKKRAQSVARLVRLTAPPTIVKRGLPKRDLIEFNYDFCETGACGDQFQQLSNATGLKNFAMGGAFLPLNVVNVYLLQESGRSRVMRNDGGAILPVPGSNSFQIAGGRDSALGESDILKISYLLSDESERETPNAPASDWLHQIAGVNIELSRSIPLVTANETASRSLRVSFPVTVRTLD